MSRNSAENWESLNHKSIRANDGSLVGNVDAIDDKPVSMSTEVACTRYKIPKHLVRGFSGQEVFLKSEKMDPERFNGRRDEGFTEAR
jgi:hypothetical protein